MSFQAIWLRDQKYRSKGRGGRNSMASGAAANTIAVSRASAVKPSRPLNPRAGHAADLGQRRREDLDSGVAILQVLVVVEASISNRPAVGPSSSRVIKFSSVATFSPAVFPEELGDAVLQRAGVLGDVGGALASSTSNPTDQPGHRAPTTSRSRRLGEGAPPRRRPAFQRPRTSMAAPPPRLRRGRIAPTARRRAHALHEIILEDLLAGDLLAAVDALLDLGQAVLDRLVGLADLVVVADPVLGRLAAAARLRGLRCFLRRPYVFGAFAGRRLDRSHAVDATLRELDGSLARRPIRLAVMALGTSESSPGILQREAVPKAHLSTRCDCVSISLNCSHLSGVRGAPSLFSLGVLFLEARRGTLEHAAHKITTWISATTRARYFSANSSALSTVSATSLPPSAWGARALRGPRVCKRGVEATHR